MGKLKKYRRKPGAAVTAVRLDLDTEGFTYQKWGGTQRCKAGDWVVENDGEVYTIDAESFESTYRQISPGRYEKFGEVWAEEASEAGSITTKEGSTDYSAGDFLVYNDAERRDGYAIEAKKFASMYEPAS